MFGSRPQDPLTGLINMRARWYSPEIGRFLSPDPAGLVDGTNLYAYASNDPVNFFDPSGLGKQATEGNVGLGKPHASLLSTIKAKLRAFVRGETALNGEQIAALIHDFGASLGTALLDGMPSGSLGADLTRAYAAGVVSLGVSAIDLVGGAVATTMDPYMLVRGILRLGEGTAMGIEEIKRGNWAMGASMITAEVATVVGLAGGGVLGARGLGGRPTRRLPCNSFTAETVVWTLDGLKPIAELRLGDEVWARSSDTGAEGWREVEHLFAAVGKAYLEITIAGAPGVHETLEATANHPFWVVGLGWTEASELIPGQELVSVDGGLLRVVSVESSDAVDDVYNFTVDELHTYFVGEVGVWVHNAKPCGGGKNFDQARQEAFENAGLTDPATVEFTKYDPVTGTVVEFKGPGNAKVGYDGPHPDTPGKYHDRPHISWQSGGKRGTGGGRRDNIAYDGPQHPSRPRR